jgi:hypothetical protein
VSDFFDFLEGPHDVDLDGDLIPDIHEAAFVKAHGDVVPDAINPMIDIDGDGVPDQVDGHIDLDGNGLDYRVAVDTGGDGMNDWLDPYSPLPGTGLSPEVQQFEELRLHNPHFR